MLMERFGSLDLNEIISCAPDFAPFPKYADRQGWLGVMPGTRQVWIETAEKYLDFAWPALRTDLYLHFKKTGENIPYLFPFLERRSILGTLALAECMEGQGRFIGQMLDGIFCICEETTWMTPFDVAAGKQDMPSADDQIVNLATSETAALLAWIHFFFKEQLDEISPRICRRIEKEIEFRVIQPYQTHDDYWWMGFVKTPRVNNWNPWCNRNVLMCLLLLDLDKDVRYACMRKLMRSLDSYLDKYPPDGCCDEGPMYWGAAGGGLHTCLYLLRQASGGVIDIFDEPIVRDIGRYIYKAHIHDQWFVDFADGDAHVKLGAAVYQYGLSIEDEHLVDLGASAEPARPDMIKWFGMYEHVLDILGEPERKAVVKTAPYIRDAWMWYTQVLFARENEGSPKGLYLAAKAGHNQESHNHNDVGNFIVYLDGNPVLIDLGTEEYTAKTFGKQRFELWYLQSQYHNCPTVRGVLQKDGRQFTAKDVTYHTDDSRAEISADIAEAYPGEAGIVSWRRTCRLNRSDRPSVEIIDDYRLAEPTDDIKWSLMTPWQPRIAIPGKIELKVAADACAKVVFDSENLEVSIDRIDTMESRLRKNWGDVMYRIVLKEKRSSSQASRSLLIRQA